MPEQPILKTERLILRPFNFNDAPQVQKLAGDKDIARTTLLIPHPYKESDAIKWIATHKPMFDIGKIFNAAVVLAESQELVGAIGLRISKRNHHAELGYWIGKPFWNLGYGTEAARRILEHGFNELNLNRIFAHYMTINPASGRIMEKIGMKYEGLLRQHVTKWDEFMDLKLYAVLRSEFQAQNNKE